MDEEKALSDLLCDLSARDGAAEAETVFRCQMWQKVAAVLPGVNFNLCGKARQGQGAQSPAYGRQLPPAPQAQVAEVPNGVWPACSRGRRSVRGIELPTGNGKAGRIGLRHGPAGGKQAGTAGQKAAGPLHAQAMVQKLQRGALGPGVDAVVADGYHRQAVLRARRKAIRWEKTDLPGAKKMTSGRASSTHRERAGENQGDRAHKASRSRPGTGLRQVCPSRYRGRREAGAGPVSPPDSRGSQAGAGPKGPEDVYVCDAEIAAAQGKLWLLGAEIELTQAVRVPAGEEPCQRAAHVVAGGKNIVTDHQDAGLVHRAGPPSLCRGARQIFPYLTRLRRR